MFGRSGTVEGCDGEFVERVIHAARWHPRGALLEVLIAVHPLRPGNLPATQPTIVMGLCICFESSLGLGEKMRTARLF